MPQPTGAPQARSPRDARPVLRFAPSPNGFLHRGHALSALLNDAAARRRGGRFLLRLEDLDTTRRREHFAAAIEEDLAWLGLGWETPVLRQSDRGVAYRQALDELERLGLLYPAFASRGEARAMIAAQADPGAWPRDPDGAPLYPGDERDWPEARRRAEIATGRPYALRLDMRRALAGAGDAAWREGASLLDDDPAERRGDPAAWGDVVLARRDVAASYHLAVTVDDAFHGVTHVVRGADLLPSTAVHRLLQTLLGLAEPVYFHHRLVRDETGTKLSKSRGSQSLRDHRAAGASAAELIAGLGLDRDLAPLSPASPSDPAPTATR